MARPWSAQAFEATGLHPAGVGVALGVVVVAIFLAIELALGRFALAFEPGDPELIFDDMRVAITHILVVVYLVTAIVYLERLSDRTAERLAPLLDEPLLARRVLKRSDRITLWVAGAIGLVVSYLSTKFSPGDVVSLDPATWSAETAWHRVLGLVMGFLIARLFTSLVRESLRLWSLADHVKEIDLLDLSRFTLFARHGLGNALLLAGLAAVYSLFLLDLAYLQVVVPVVGMMSVVAAVGLMLPLWGAHRRIREAKQRELRWCAERIGVARRRLGGETAEEVAPMDELAAYRTLVAGVREWPIDASIFTRFGLYLLIPLGSWAGGALVERLIDAALD